MVVGNEHAYFVKGKVVIAAANPDLMENYIEEDDLVILGNRYESQLCAIEMKAGCIIVCEGAPVSKTIQRLAADRVCAVISTPHDTYTVARLINQSMPVKFFMKSSNLITFHLDDYTDSIKDVMAKKRYRDFPILDKNDRYVGMVSRRNLLGIKRRQADSRGPQREIPGRGQHRGVPIFWRLSTITAWAPWRPWLRSISGTSLWAARPRSSYQIYQERKLEIPKNIAGLLCAAIISDTLMFRSTHLHGSGPRQQRSALAEIAGIKCEAICHRDVCGRQQPERPFSGGNFLSGFQEIRAQQGELRRGSDQLDEPRRAQGAQEPPPSLHGKELWEPTARPCSSFMLTDIIHQSTELLCYGGENARSWSREAFHLETPVDHAMILPGVVSTKETADSGLYECPAAVKGIMKRGEKRQ